MHRFLIAAAMALGLAAVAEADQLIYQNTGTASNFSIITVYDTAGGASSNTSEAADDFRLTAPMTVTQIAPQYFFGSAFNIDRWNIRIYSDDAGVPGTELLSTTAPGGSYVLSPPDQVPTLTLEEPFAAAADTPYWISLQAAFTQSQGTGVRWRETVAADPTAVQGSVGYWRGTPVFGGLAADWAWEPVGRKNSVAATGELMFSLYGVPEPASLALIGLGALAFSRRRQTRHASA